jgi:large subunit ribosomal protein L22
MTGAKTNERPGTRAQVRHARFSATKARAVLDLIRNLPADEAADVLRFAERSAAETVGRCLASAVANAQHNDELDGETLYVSACYADEGPTLKRWRPRARGRATRIRKRTCHITIIVSPMPPDMAAKVEAKREAAPVAAGGRRRRPTRESRRARVARSRGEATETHDHEHDHDHDHEHEHDEVVTEDVATEDVTTEDVATEDVTTEQVVSDAISADADIEDKGAADAEADAEPEAEADEAEADEEKK